MSFKHKQNVFRTPIKTKIKRAAMFTAAFFLLKLGVEGIFNTAYSQNQKAKAQTEEPQEPLKSNERRIVLEPVDAISDSAAIAFRAKCKEKGITLVKIVGKTRTFKVTVPNTQGLTSGDATGIALYLFRYDATSDIPLNNYDAYKAQKDGTLVNGSYWCTFNLNGWILFGIKGD